MSSPEPTRLSARGRVLAIITIIMLLSGGARLIWDIAPIVVLILPLLWLAGLVQHSRSRFRR